MDHKRIFPYEVEDQSHAAPTGNVPSKPASSAPRRRAPLEQGNVATVISGSDGDRHALIGALELMECAARGTMTVPELIAWFDEYMVKPEYMRRPTRVFENGVGTVYLGAAKKDQKTQETILRRVLEVARKEVCSVLSGLLESPPDDRFIRYQMVTGRIYNTEVNAKPVWRVRARSDDRLSGIVLSLLAADIMSNQQTYYQRLSVCSECGRISFRLDTTNRKRCPAHESAAPRALGQAS